MTICTLSPTTVQATLWTASQNWQRRSCPFRKLRMLTAGQLGFLVHCCHFFRRQAVRDHLHCGLNRSPESNGRFQSGSGYHLVVRQCSPGLCDDRLGDRDGLLVNESLVFSFTDINNSECLFTKCGHNSNFIIARRRRQRRSVVGGVLSCFFHHGVTESRKKS